MKFCKDCKYLNGDYCSHPTSVVGIRGNYMVTGMGNELDYFQAAVMRESSVITRCGEKAQHFEPIEQQQPK